MKLTVAQQKDFIKDYYGRMSYKDLYLKYGLNKSQADKIWDELLEIDTQKHFK